MLRRVPGTGGRGPPPSFCYSAFLGKFSLRNPADEPKRMSYQVLARKWRPKTFKQLVGQESVVQALENGLDNDRVHHAFLFTGTRGVGKTTIARILAKCLNCETGVTSTPCGVCSSCVDIDEGRFQDMLEIDAASRTKVDDTRELLESVQFAPARGRYKVYIIDEVHMLSMASFNALLKTLEEPPPHVKFVLATTDPQKIPVTILSRCLRFNLRRLLPSQISEYLEHLLKEESIESEASAVGRIARAADGSMRDALSLLDQAIAFGGGRLEDDDVAQMMGSVDHEHIARLVEGLGNGDAGSLLEIVRELAAQSRNLESVLAELSEVLHRMNLLQLAPGYRDPERSDWDSIETLAGQISPEDVQLWYQIAIQGRRDLGLAPDPRTGLEMSLLRMLAFRPAEAAVADPGQAAPAQQAPVTAGAGKSGASQAASGQSSHAAAATANASRPSEPSPAAQDAGPVGPPPPTAATLTLADEVDWHEFMERLGLKGPVRELARHLQLEGREGDQWRFLLSEEVSYLGSDSLVGKLQKELAAQLGQPIQLKISQVRETAASPAVASQQAELRQISDAERAINDDETVRSLKDSFDAHILEDSIQPLQ